MNVTARPTQIIWTAHVFLPTPRLQQLTPGILAYSVGFAAVCLVELALVVCPVIRVRILAAFWQSWLTRSCIRLDPHLSGQRKAIREKLIHICKPINSHVLRSARTEGPQHHALSRFIRKAPCKRHIYEDTSLGSQASKALTCGRALPQPGITRSSACSRFWPSSPLLWSCTCAPRTTPAQ